MNKFGKALTLTATVPAAATTTWKDFLINGGIFVLSAIITYVTNNLANLDLGSNTAAIVAIVALVLKYLQNFINGLMAPKTPEPVVPVNPPNPGPNFPIN